MFCFVQTNRGNGSLNHRLSKDISKINKVGSLVANRLLPRNAEHLLFVHENIANVKYEYWFEYHRNKRKMQRKICSLTAILNT